MGSPSSYVRKKWLKETTEVGISTVTVKGMDENPSGAGMVEKVSGDKF